MRNTKIITFPQIQYVNFHHNNTPVSGQAVSQLCQLPSKPTPNSWLKEENAPIHLHHCDHLEPPKKVKTRNNGALIEVFRYADKTTLLKVTSNNNKIWFPLAFQTEIFPNETMAKTLAESLINVPLGPTNESTNVWEHTQFYRPYVLHQNKPSPKNLSTWSALLDVLRHNILDVIPREQRDFFNVLLFGRHILADQTLSKPKIIFDGLNDDLDEKTEKWLDTLNDILFENNSFSFQSIIDGGGNERCRSNIILKTGPDTPTSNAHQKINILKNMPFRAHLNKLSDVNSNF